MKGNRFTATNIAGTFARVLLPLFTWRKKVGVAVLGLSSMLVIQPFQRTGRMPTILTHAIIPMAIGIAAGRARISRRLLLAGIVASILPDADVAGYWLGVPYAALAGHRGITHSLLFALALGGLGALFARQLRSTALFAFVIVCVSTLSHPLLDMLTNGGLGVALWTPWSSERVFFPTRPIEVASLRPERMFSGQGLTVLVSEFKWICLPATALSVPCWIWRHLNAQRGRVLTERRDA